MNKEQTILFANDLFESKNYGMAAQEFERVIFLDSTNINAKTKLLQSYRLNGSYQFGINKINKFFPINQSEMPDSFAREYTRLLLANNNIPIAYLFLENSKNINIYFKANYKIGLSLMTKEWNKAITEIIGFSEPQKLNQTLVALCMESQQMQYKSSFLAAAMSMVVPGSGKMYCKKWQEGLLSFVVVASSCFASYSGFSVHGSESITGYIFGGMAISYYGATIYESYQAVKQYNEELENNIVNKAHGIVRSIE